MYYCGVASIRSGDLRQKDFHVMDEREKHYIGHAEIDLGIRTPDNDEPENPNRKKALKDRCDAILNMARHLQDPHRESEEWLGEPMCE